MPDFHTHNTVWIKTLEALQGRVRRLLFINPTDADSAANLTRLARQLNVYLNAYVQTLQEGTAAGKTSPQGERPIGQPDSSPLRFVANGEELLTAIDAYLADPSSGSTHAALAETITRICGTPAPIFLPPAPRTSPGGPDPAPVPGENQTPAIDPRYHASAPLGWQSELGALRRRASLAILLAGLAFIGTTALLIAQSDRLSSPASQQDLQPRPGAPTEGHGDPAPAPDSHTTGPDDTDSRALRQIPERFAELDMQVLNLAARVDALEAHQIATDRALARTREPISDTPAVQTAETSPSPPAPATDTQSSNRGGGYGIQIAALKNSARVAKFLEENRLNPRQVRIEKTGTGTILILGLFPDRAKAAQVITSLPPTLQRQQLMIRRFAPGQEPPLLATDSTVDPSRP